MTRHLFFSLLFGLELFPLLLLFASKAKQYVKISALFEEERYEQEIAHVHREP